MSDYSDLFSTDRSLADGLLSYFSFNDTSGWRAESHLGSSPAYISTRPTDYVRTDEIQAGLTFDGATTIRHVVAKDATEPEAPDAKSVVLRFRVDDLSRDRTQILLETGDGHNGLNIYLQGDQLVVGAWNKGVWSAFLTRGMPADGAWHDVSFSYEAGRDGGQFEAYLDGLQFGKSEVGTLEAFAPYITLGGTSGGTNIDGGQLAGSNRFAGQIDELAVFERALTPQEIGIFAGITPSGIYGTPEDDVLSGTDAGDDIYALAGDDWVRAGAGNDTVEGDEGSDLLEGGAGNDYLLGNDGNDQFFGGSGDDRIAGGGGNADTAIYASVLSDYDLSLENPHGTLYVTALGTNEGTDEVHAVERLQFTDFTLAWDPETESWQTEETYTGSSGDNAVAPSTGINLTFNNDWSGELAFLDLMHSARTFGSINSSGQSNNEDQTGILTFDENGWVSGVEDPDVTSYFIPILQDQPGNGAPFQAGRYVVRYEGDGELWTTIHYSPDSGGDPLGDVEVVESGPGRLVFDYTPGEGTVRLVVGGFPADPADYVRDIEVVWEPYEPLLDQGETFTPEFLDSLSGFNSIRFMNWMNVNEGRNNWYNEGAPFRSPDTDDLVSPDYYSYSSARVLQSGVEGVPVEVMVELANKTGTDPWFTLPFGATNDYIETFGTYVRDHLDPGLKAYFEYGNEVWNYSFAARLQADTLGRELFGEDSWHPYDQYYAVEAARMSYILQDLWGADPDDQLVTVMSKQTGDNSYLLDLMMNTPDFVALGDDVPEQFADIAGLSPLEVGIDALGITSYFHTDFYNNATEVAAMVSDGTDEEWAAVIDRMINGENGLMERSAIWTAIAEDAQAYGLQVVGYEGNQHIRHNYSDPEYQAFLNELFERPEMADVLTTMMETWQSVGGGQMEVFQDVGISYSGRWGLRVHQFDDNTAMFDAVTEFSENNNMWWGDDRDASVFEDALIVVSEAGDTTLTGGNRDDLFLVRHSSVASIFAGSGDDTVILDGDAEDFVYSQVHLQGNGYDVALSGVEQLVFSDASVNLFDI